MGNERAAAVDDDKELKVEIPLGFHLRLHELKVLKGWNISATVEQALEGYFERLAERSEGRRLEEISDRMIDAFADGEPPGGDSG